jgi:hypothetical protein
MPEAEEDIDFEQVVWDPRYRREVIERLNRKSAERPPDGGTGRESDRGDA